MIRYTALASARPSSPALHLSAVFPLALWFSVALFLVICPASSLSAAEHPPPSPERLPFFAFQNGTLRDGAERPAPETAALLKDLGYDGLSASGYEVAPLIRELRARGLKLFNTYLTLELDSASPRVRLDLAHSLGGLASILLKKRDLGSALEASRRSDALSAEAAQADPGNAVALLAALRGERRTCSILGHLNRLDEAEAGLRSLAGRAEALVAKGTSLRASTVLLADVYADLGYVLERRADRETDAAHGDALRRAAWNAFERSRGTWERLDAKTPLAAHERERQDGVRKALQSSGFR